MDTNQLVVKVSVDNSELNAKFGESVDSAKQTGEKMSEAIMLVEAKEAIGELTEKMADFGREAVQAAAKVGALRRELAPLITDGKQLDEIVGLAREIGANTKLSAEDVAAGAREFKIFGQLSKENMEAAKDLSAVTGQSFSAVAADIGKIARGAEGSDRAVMMMARSMGIGATELGKFGAVIQDGKVFLGTKDAAEKAAEAIRRFRESNYHDAAEKMVSSTEKLNKHIEELQADIGAAGAKMKAARAEALIPWVDTLDKWVKLHPQLAGSIGIMGEAGSKVVSFGGGLLQLGAQIGIIKNAFPAAETAMGKFGGGATALKGALAGVSGGLALTVAGVFAAAAGFGYYIHTMNEANKAAEEHLKIEEQLARWLHEEKDLIRATADEWMHLGKTAADVAKLRAALVQERDKAQAHGDTTQVDKINQEIAGLNKVLQSYEAVEQATAKAEEDTKKHLEDTQHQYKLNQATIQDLMAAEQARIAELKREIADAPEAKKAAMVKELQGLEEEYYGHTRQLQKEKAEADKFELEMEDEKAKRAGNAANFRKQVAREQAEDALRAAEDSAEEQVDADKRVLEQKKASHTETVADERRLADDEIALAQRVRDEKIRAGEDELTKTKEAEAEKVREAQRAVDAAKRMQEDTKGGTKQERVKAAQDVEKAEQHLADVQQAAQHAIAEVSHNVARGRIKDEDEYTKKVEDDAAARKAADLASIEAIKTAEEDLADRRRKAQKTVLDLALSTAEASEGAKGGGMDQIGNILKQQYQVATAEAQAAADREMKAKTEQINKEVADKKKAAELIAGYQKQLNDEVLQAQLKALDDILKKYEAMKVAPQDEAAKHQAVNDILQQRANILKQLGQDIGGPTQQIATAAADAQPALADMADNMKKVADHAERAAGAVDKMNRPTGSSPASPLGTFAGQAGPDFAFSGIGGFGSNSPNDFGPGAAPVGPGGVDPNSDLGKQQAAAAAQAAKYGAKGFTGLGTAASQGFDWATVPKPNPGADQAAQQAGVGAAMGQAGMHPMMQQYQQFLQSKPPKVNVDNQTEHEITVTVKAKHDPHGGADSQIRETNRALYYTSQTSKEFHP